MDVSRVFLVPSQDEALIVFFIFETITTENLEFNIFSAYIVSTAKFD